jgi:hypothetical protein
MEQYEILAVFRVRFRGGRKLKACKAAGDYEAETII